VKNRPDNCLHLTVALVEEIHSVALQEFGGTAGVRDAALLDSAVAAPQATFGGASVYADLTEVAAAYLFFLCRNHAFVDGNKRTAMMAAIVFLRLNGIEPAPDSESWEQLLLDVSSSNLDREQTTARLKALVPQHSRKRRK
jgi:death-on-curing protein